MKTARSLSIFVGLLGGVALLATGASAQVIADAGADRVVTLEAGCEAQVSLDGSGSQTEPGVEATYTWTGPFPEGEGTVVGPQVAVTLDVGVHEITLAVAAGGESSTDTVEVRVKESTPPTIESVSASPGELWPPNHQLVEVDVDVRVSDDCDEAPVCEIYGIESDEPEDDRGDGNTAPDSRIAGKLTAELRAERSGRGDGRVYTIRVKCSDDSGNVSRSKTIVRVPHDQGGGDDGGSGGGPDRCRLRASFDRIEKNRLMARIDVSTEDDAVPENETPTRVDDLEGYELTLVVAGAEFVAIVSDDGVAVGDGIVARWLPAQGAVMVDIRGADLPEILGLDPGERGKRIPVSVPVVLRVRWSEEGSDPIVLFDEDLACAYRSKGMRGGGPRR